ncbi:hypothetical protein EG68_00648 [Paragonimus skrjabini miyazakii]|uniref:Uncharacterized protein n=1 Tax=Paragonimus skrjabini miyazakii TaxID=59628 RepID=A0A8S9Z8L0_9TREM|nr:hypothetical protein EG68_00648 [Paragonimus skrjabini miyazakii]
MKQLIIYNLERTTKVPCLTVRENPFETIESRFYRNAHKMENTAIEFFLWERTWLLRTLTIGNFVQLY